MPLLTSRTELKDYCLRRLGYPVIEINVDDDQVEERIDDALQFWQEYHFDGVERVYLREQITGSTLTLSATDAGLYTVGETVTGETSGATAQVYAGAGTALTVYRVVGTFVASEVLTGALSGASQTLAATNFLVLGNLDKQYLTISDAVTSVVRVLRIGQGGGGNTSTNIFDMMYQFRMNDMYSLMSADMIYYSQMKMHLQLLDDLFVGERTVRFNRKSSRLFIDMDWYNSIQIGDYVIVEGHRILDPETFTKVYDDMFLKKYLTALIKRQWGANMSKFAGIQMPGGVTLDGVRIYKEANDEITKLEEEMQSRYELPVDFMVG